MEVPVEPTGMTIIEQYPTAEAAQTQAAFLVERGVGATVETDPGSGQPALAVLDDDAERAREVLGLALVERHDPSETELVSANRAWLIPVVLIGLALLVVPIIAFFVAFKVAGG
jgi:hypothetical protein